MSRGGKTFRPCVKIKLFSVTGNLLSVSGGDNNVTVWRQMADGEWACILDQGLFVFTLSFILVFCLGEQGN
jgi:hypothetical protein